MGQHSEQVAELTGLSPEFLFRRAMIHKFQRELYLLRQDKGHPHTAAVNYTLRALKRLRQSQALHVNGVVANVESLIVRVKFFERLVRIEGQNSKTHNQIKLKVAQQTLAAATNKLAKIEAYL